MISLQEEKLTEIDLDIGSNIVIDTIKLHINSKTYDLVK